MFAELLGGDIFNSDGNSWRTQRKAASARVHSARFLRFSAGTIKRLVHSARLLETLSKQGARGGHVGCFL